jgi:hypothetical protein
MRAVKANRWSILAGYGLLATCTQLLWLSYARRPVRGRRRGLLLAAVGVSVLAFAAIAVGYNAGFVACVLFVEGFFLLAALPVVLDWSALHAGEQRAGEAVGFLLLAGNLGGIVLVLIVQVLIDSPVAALPGEARRPAHRCA